VQGFTWDEQRKGGVFYRQFVDYATAAIGIYGAATGTPEATLLTIENDWAAVSSHYAPYTVYDQNYTHLPASNVYNTDLG
jgi:hypothetical protein